MFTLVYNHFEKDVWI